MKKKMGQKERPTEMESAEREKVVWFGDLFVF